MASEFSLYLKERFLKGKDKNATVEQMNRQRVKNAISDLCQQYLTEAGQILKFEVSPKDLPHAIIVIDEEPLKSMYNIIQVDETLFEASLQELAF